MSLSSSVEMPVKSHYDLKEVKQRKGVLAHDAKKETVAIKQRIYYKICLDC